MATITRFGSRYGRRIRTKLAQVESQHRGKHSCANCGYKQVRRQAAGIWHCSKCDRTFTGRAYTPTSRKGLSDHKEEQTLVVASKPKLKKERLDVQEE